MISPCLNRKESIGDIIRKGAGNGVSLVLLPGVAIGERALIGEGAVVKKMFTSMR